MNPARRWLGVLVLTASVGIGAPCAGSDDATPTTPAAADEHDAAAITRRSESLGAEVSAAVACYERGDLRCAVSHLERARALRPANAQVRFMLGNAYYRSGDWLTASVEYREAARLRPAHPDTYLNLGFSLYHSQRWSDAVQAWTTAVERSAANALPRLALAVGLERLERRRDALVQLRHALRLQPAACQPQLLRIDIRWSGSALHDVEHLCSMAVRCG